MTYYIILSCSVDNSFRLSIMIGPQLSIDYWAMIDYQRNTIVNWWPSLHQTLDWFFLRSKPFEQSSRPPGKKKVKNKEKKIYMWFQSLTPISISTKKRREVLVTPQKHVNSSVISWDFTMFNLSVSYNSQTWKAQRICYPPL